LQWVVEAAKQSRVDRIIVSSEDSEILSLAERLGVDLHRRPPELSEDDVTALEVTKHVAHRQRNLFTHVIQLLPTSPLVLPEDIDRALALLSTGCDSVSSVFKIKHGHPIRAFRLENDRISPLSTWDETKLQKQDFPPAYAFNGAIFARKIELLLSWNGKDLCLGKDARAIVIPYERSINIDDEIDILIAETLILKVMELKSPP